MEQQNIHIKPVSYTHLVAIHYYGRDITWKQIKEETDKVARALKAVGFGENDEIPMFLRSVPEFIFLLLGAEKIGASLPVSYTHLVKRKHE